MKVSGMIELETRYHGLQLFNIPNINRAMASEDVDYTMLHIGGYFIDVKMSYSEFKKLCEKEG